LKVIADHLRAAVFMAGDGMTPGNNGRDYVMRRFIRRAFLTGRQLDYHQPFLHRIVPIVAQGYGDIYPEVREREELITDLIRREEERFESTLDAGMSRLEDLLTSLRLKNETRVPATKCFDSTIPTDSRANSPKKSRAKATSPSTTKGIMSPPSGIRVSAAPASANTSSAPSATWKRVSSATIGWPKMPQLSVYWPEKAPRKSCSIARRFMRERRPDRRHGQIVGGGFAARVLNTQKQGKASVHTVEVTQGEPLEGSQVRAIVDAPRRRAIERAHSATHLLHASLRQHLASTSSSVARWWKRIGCASTSCISRPLHRNKCRKSKTR
jgi:alanyl-tRNA synthetase